MNQEETNGLELAAWDEWKRECAIVRCSNEHADALRRRIYNAARRRLDALNVMDGEWWKDEEPNGNGFKPSEECKETWKRIFAERFDSGIEEKAVGKKCKQKHYKDDVWTKVGSSDDPPLKVIRGQLTGPQGILTVFIERLVKERGWGEVLRGSMKHEIQTWRNADGEIVIGRKVTGGKGRFFVSPYKNIAGEDGDNEEDDSAGCLERGGNGRDGGGNAITGGMREDDRMLISKMVEAHLTVDDSVLLVAEDYGIRADDGYILEFLGKKKTAAYNASRKAVEKFKELLFMPEIRDVMHDVGEREVMETALEAIKEQTGRDRRVAEFVNGLEKRRGGGEAEKSE